MRLLQQYTKVPYLFDLCKQLFLKFACLKFHILLYVYSHCHLVCFDLLVVALNYHKTIYLQIVFLLCGCYHTVSHLELNAFRGIIKKQLLMRIGFSALRLKVVGTSSRIKLVCQKLVCITFSTKKATRFFTTTIRYRQHFGYILNYSRMPSVVTDCYTKSSGFFVEKVIQASL